MKKIVILSIVISALSFFSCGTIKELPENLTAAQIIQKGQNALESSNWKNAEYCYETVIERYGTNPATYVEAKYELGNVYYKSKKYQQAYDTFSELLQLYDYNASAFPGAYKKLAQIGLNKIPKNKLAKASEEKKEDASK